MQIGSNNANDDDEDLDRPVWAGRVPLKLVPGEPVPCPKMDKPYEVPRLHPALQASHGDGQVAASAVHTLTCTTTQYIAELRAGTRLHAGY